LLRRSLRISDLMLGSYFLTYLFNSQAKPPDEPIDLAVPEYSPHRSGFIRQHHAVDGQPMRRAARKGFARHPTDIALRKCARR
jgi:hypothetical protein